MTMIARQKKSTSIACAFSPHGGGEASCLGTIGTIGTMVIPAMAVRWEYKLSLYSKSSFTRMRSHAKTRYWRRQTVRCIGSLPACSVCSRRCIITRANACISATRRRSAYCMSTCRAHTGNSRHAAGIMTSLFEACMLPCINIHNGGDRVSWSMYHTIWYYYYCYYIYSYFKYINPTQVICKQTWQKLHKTQKVHIVRMWTGNQ